MRKVLLIIFAAASVLGACTRSPSPAERAAATNGEVWEQPVPRAKCGPDDVVELGLQGQVTIPERVTGFKGTHCNLELVGQLRGQGAAVGHAVLGHCAYYSQAAAIGLTPGAVPERPGLVNKGVVVVDVSDPAHPVASDWLDSVAFVDPWESLKLNEPRQLLAAVNGLASAGGPEFDVYDLSQDCAHPKLLASVTLSDTRLKGHEGNWAPDGQTYYGSDANGNNIYYAIDVKDPRAPRLIAEWSPPNPGPPGFAAHGLSLSPDGNRGYFARAGGLVTNLIPGSEADNGFYVLDTSEIQARKPNPQIKVLSTTTWRDGAGAQHTIPVLIKGHPYLIHVDELGSAGLGTANLGSGANWASACSQELPPFGLARIYDISSETAPKLVSKIMLEVNDPAHCDEVVGDNIGQGPFGYDTHYCAVDDLKEASLLMCGQFASGLRVYDIRDPHRPREIAYYNPPAQPGYQAGSGYALNGVCGLTDWVGAMPVLKKDSGQIWFVSACNGFQVLEFTNGVWPLK